MVGGSCDLSRLLSERISVAATHSSRLLVLKTFVNILFRIIRFIKFYFFNSSPNLVTSYASLTTCSTPFRLYFFCFTITHRSDSSSLLAQASSCQGAIMPRVQFCEHKFAPYCPVTYLLNANFTLQVIERIRVNVHQVSS